LQKSGAKFCIRGQRTITIWNKPALRAESRFVPVLLRVWSEFPDLNRLRNGWR